MIALEGSDLIVPMAITLRMGTHEPIYLNWSGTVNMHTTAICSKERFVTSKLAAD